MQKKSIILLLIALISFASCERIGEWFAHEIPYDGDVNQGELVVTAEIRAGEAPCVFVNESNFFLDPIKTESDTVTEVYYDGDSLVVNTSVWENQLRRGFVENANVSMQINGANPIMLTGHWQKDTLHVSDYSSVNHVRNRYRYTTNVCPQPGDTVLLTVTAPGHKEIATVTQVLPKLPVVEILDTIHRERYALPNHLIFDHMVVKVKLPGQDWPTGTMLRFESTMGTSDNGCYYRRDERDTYIYHNHWTTNFIYSQSSCFAACVPINQTLSMGHYGGGKYGMYVPANHDDMEVTLLLPYTYEYSRDGLEVDDNNDTIYHYARIFQVDSLVLTVSAVTRDEYLYIASMISAEYLANNVSDMWYDAGAGGNNDDYDIIGTIQDAFDELGSLEGIQLYGNMRGAIGHVTASSPLHVILDKKPPVILEK